MEDTRGNHHGAVGLAARCMESSSAIVGEQVHKDHDLLVPIMVHGSNAVLDTS